MFERLSEDMDRQAARLVHEAVVLSERIEPSGEGLNAAASNTFPAGAQSYAFVAAASGTGFCARSVEMISQGDGQAPRVVSRSYGDCAMRNTAKPQSLGVPRNLPHKPQTITVKTQKAQPQQARSPVQIENALWRP